MTETTSNKDTLAAALARAQAAMVNVTKDSANPHFRSRFASLAAVRDVVVPALAAQGIAVVQMPGNDEQGRVTVRTLLLHSAGELDCGTVATSATVRGGNEAQAVGSALSYLRRYALASIAGVAQEDDDGNASGPARQPRRASAAPAPMHLALQAARDKLRAVFGDDVDDARKMVRESTGLDIREALADVDACKTILAALAKG